MTKKDLQKFCADDGFRKEIAKPCTSEGTTYATNGHIIIAVPALPDVQENMAAPRAAALFEKIPIPDDWFPIAELPEIPTLTEKVPCDRCSGTGEIECRECGSTVECPECGGDGKLEPRTPFILHKIGGVSFDAKYLHLLKNFPGVEIGPNGEGKAARIRFEGGEGLLMPVR